MLGLACDNGLLCTLGSNNMNTASKSAPRNRYNDERLSCQKNLAKVSENGANFQLSNTALVLYHLTRTRTVATTVNLKFMQSMALLLFILIPLIAAHYLKTSAMT
jgi:hypothetical protein